MYLCNGVEPIDCNEVNVPHVSRCHEGAIYTCQWGWIPDFYRRQCDACEEGNFYCNGSGQITCGEGEDYVKCNETHVQLCRLGM